MPKLNRAQFQAATLRIFIAALLSVVGLIGLASESSAGATLVPTAADDEYSVTHDQTLNVAAPGVLANDVLPPGWEISVFSGPSFGVLVFNTDGSFQYTPFPGFVGDDSFVYQMTIIPPALIEVLDAGAAQVEPAGVVPQATVTIHVTNAPPVPVDDSYATDQDTPLNVPAPGVLVNDSDPEGDPIAITGLGDDVDHGTLVFDTSTGAFDYTPDPGFVGVDTFQYLVVDVLPVPKKQSLSNGVTAQGLDGIPATVTITVTGVDTPTPEPTAEPTEPAPTTEPGEPTATPEPPAPTPTTAPKGGVTDLPSTGSGHSNEDQGALLLIGLVAILLLTTGIVTGARRAAQR